MNGVVSIVEDCSEFAEVDPTGRYGRYDEILGKGASKTVYRAFDEYEGIEVAWNKVKLHDFMRNPEDLEKLYREIHLLKTLKHENIMKFYTSFVDTTNLSINFLTELFTSGTLRQYRLKHKRVNIRAVKHWCRQILEGLLYLHSHSPPIIHRDLKCDNIFVNGNQGEVKIGDLGLAAILRKSHAARCVGTPEFMAPEVYEEEYNELVDIYSFGMCILEMVTFEYPYSECTHPVQIYKKVISGKRPEAFYKVKDPEVRQFVEKCLATVACRLTAFELLQDPFLQIDDDGFDMRAIDYCHDYDEAGPFLRQPRNGSYNSLLNGFADYPWSYHGDGFHYQDQLESQISEISLFTNQDDEHFGDTDISIKGKRRDDDGIFLRLRIADTEGRIRNIYFAFDTETDTAWSVAAEMVSELDITNQDVAKIADMIDAEIATLVPGWKTEKNVLESFQSGNSGSFCQACASNGYIQETVSSNMQTAERSRHFECSKHENASSVRGRFEEITYQVEGQEQCVKEGESEIEPDGVRIHYADIWAQREKNTLSDEKGAESSVVVNPRKFDKCWMKCTGENEIRQELRWLKARYRLQLTRLKDQTLHFKDLIDAKSSSSVFPPNNWENMGLSRRDSSDNSFRTEALVPLPLHRATSLPVDAVHI